jgi:hypothetical protein
MLSLELGLYQLRLNAVKGVRLNLVPERKKNYGSTY